MATVADVAKRAGVSVSTAARVLSGTGYAAEDTRRIVLDAAKAKLYFRKVCDKVAELVMDTIRRWDAAGL